MQIPSLPHLLTSSTYPPLRPRFQVSVQTAKYRSILQAVTDFMQTSDNEETSSQRINCKPTFTGPSQKQ